MNTVKLKSRGNQGDLVRCVCALTFVNYKLKARIACRCTPAARYSCVLFFAMRTNCIASFCPVIDLDNKSEKELVVYYLNPCNSNYKTMMKD